MMPEILLQDKPFLPGSVLAQGLRARLGRLLRFACVELVWYYLGKANGPYLLHIQSGAPCLSTTILQGEPS